MGKTNCQTINENYSGLSLRCSLGRDVSGRCTEMTLAHYSEIYGCIEHFYNYFKIVRFIHNAMKHMINKTETKSSQQSLKQNKARQV